MSSDFTKELKILLSDAGCHFVRHGRVITISGIRRSVRSTFRLMPRSSLATRPTESSNKPD